MILDIRTIALDRVGFAHLLPDVSGSGVGSTPMDGRVLLGVSVVHSSALCSITVVTFGRDVLVFQDDRR